MISYIIRRLLLLLPTAFLALSFLFLLFFVLPGDTATLLAGGANRNVDPEVVAARRRALPPQRLAVLAVLALLGADVPLGPRPVVREQPQRQRHPAGEGAAQPPPRLLGVDDRHLRRHLGRSDLVGQALLGRPTRSRRSSPLPRRRSRCSCSASCSSTRSRSTRTSTTGRSGRACGPRGSGPTAGSPSSSRRVDQWRYLDPPGDRAWRR